MGGKRKDMKPWSAERRGPHEIKVNEEPPSNGERKRWRSLGENNEHDAEEKTQKGKGITLVPRTAQTTHCRMSMKRKSWR